MTTFIYSRKENITQNGEVVYWFVANNPKLEEYNGSEFGVVVGYDDVTIVDDESCPVVGAWYEYLLDGIEDAINMTTFNEFQNADDAILTLNAAGVSHLKNIVEEHANFAWTGEASQLHALSTNDHGFNSDGEMNLELTANETKSGSAFTYTLDFENHFNCEIH